MWVKVWHGVSVLFSEPKIPQFSSVFANICTTVCFSALQRAENSSMAYCGARCALVSVFQCSSASRKFLNFVETETLLSALDDVSVLFSEPKIPQSVACTASHAVCAEFQCSSASRKFLNPALRRLSPASRRVSVLFSEPKIPQCRPTARRVPATRRFSALQRAENSSIFRTANICQQ